MSERSIMVCVLITVIALGKNIFSQLRWWFIYLLAAEIMQCSSNIKYETSVYSGRTVGMILSVRD